LTAYKEAGDVENRGAGWVLFAGIMLFLAGILKFFDAIWAFPSTASCQPIWRVRFSGTA